MKKSYLLAVAAVALIGCKNDSSPGDMGSNPDLTKVTAALTAVSGFTVDIDLLGGNLAMNPSISAANLIAMSCVKNTPVYGLYEEGGQTATVMADAMCNYTVMAEQGKHLHMVAAANDATKVMNTYSQDVEIVGTDAINTIPAHVCTSNFYAAPAGVAAALGVTPEAVQAQGICMFGTTAHFTPPFVALDPSTVGTVTPAGFDVYAMTDPTTMPPTFVKQAASPIGIYGITKTGLTAATTITVSATVTSGSDTYAPYACDVKPGFVTFGPVSPSN